MKKNIVSTAFPFILFLYSFLPLQANHLDGLWRSDRNQLTLRIEQEEEGFRAKRTDQGIWYHYSTDDNRHFVDRYGNWYELLDDDEIAWHELNSTKRIYFTKIDNWNNDRWDNYGNNYDPFGNSNPDRWNHAPYLDARNNIEGNWYARNGDDGMQIESFGGGIKVKTHHGGWKKFYPDRSGNRFRDNNGNTIRFVENDKLRFRNQNSGEERIFTRDRNWRRHQYS